MIRFVVILSAALARSVEVTDADLVPGHRTTVIYDEACRCRVVEVEPLAADAPLDDIDSYMLADHTIAED